jgi:hypothetical protein
MRSVNPWHVLIALAIGAVLMHLYRTKTSRGQQQSGP